MTRGKINLNRRRIWVSKSREKELEEVKGLRWQEDPSRSLGLLLPLLFWTGQLSAGSPGTLTFGAHVGSFSLERETEAPNPFFFKGRKWGFLATCSLDAGWDQVTSHLGHSVQVPIVTCVCHLVLRVSFPSALSSTVAGPWAGHLLSAVQTLFEFLEGQVST